MATDDQVRTVLTLAWQVRDEAEQLRDLPDAGQVVTLGRATANDVAVDHPTVSRRHADLVVGLGSCTLRDLDSTYGTRLNGARVVGEARVAPGDAFMLGGVRFTLGQRTEVMTAADGLTDDGHEIDMATTIVRPIAPPTAPTPAVAGVTTEAQAAEATQASRLVRLLSQISTTLVQQRDLPKVLETVVDLVFQAVSAERAILLLRESSFDPLTVRVARGADGQTLHDARLSRTVVNIVIRDRVAMLADDALVDSRLDLAHSVRALSIRSFMCAPLWNRNEVIGVLYADTPRSRKFSEDDLAVFVALANYAAVAIEHARLTARLFEESRQRERLQRYHSPGVVERILRSDTEAGAFDTQVREVTVMFVDLVGFTTLSEGLEPDAVAALLNEFFHEMADVLFDHQGTLDKFIGDAILAVFGAPLPQEDHAAKAVDAALAMRRELAALNARHPDRLPLRMRIAIHTGRALTGDIGSPMRREFTVLGDAVNTASRLESTVAAPGQIVVSLATLERAGGRFRTTPLGPVTLRGRQSVIEVYAVED
ncbi:adenylate cyclase [Luteitalea sp. TBR-22]|uniref:adenylate/guanylate cyclase domain-containing protein n=1 Tax=Luteitalea sp. TBR-22 TaxID=2802971 RepID=UPI001AFC9971|nr:adenylate/guanylate cyclase domain-containing protein [Luteitalea sp. TBR-22]BCS31771.1 adenylate cyclase [Luteitalea sp. TBR-22]